MLPGRLSEPEEPWVRADKPALRHREPARRRWSPCDSWPYVGPGNRVITRDTLPRTRAIRVELSAGLCWRLWACELHLKDTTSVQPRQLPSSGPNFLPRTIKISIPRTMSSNPGGPLLSQGVPPMVASPLPDRPRDTLIYQDDGSAYIDLCWIIGLSRPCLCLSALELCRPAESAGRPGH